MESVRTFIELNRDLILFSYGLVFFGMGLSVALHSRYYSRLDLARSLPWLAAFGICNGLYQWGELFAPLQAVYLSETGLQLLHDLHLVLLAVSFACLFEFGVSLLRPLGRLRWLHGLSAGPVVVWFVFVFFPLPSLVPDPHQWHNTTDALARYFIGLPAGLLAAHGLRQQTFQRIAPLNVPHIVNTLRVAGAALALFALFGGLTPPPVAFFPGNLLNAVTLEQTLGAPPEVFRALVGLTLAVTIIRALEIFDVEIARTIEAMEQHQILAAEHDRLAREIHDNTLQKAYSAGLLIEAAYRQAGPDSLLGKRLVPAMTALQDVIGDLRQTLGQLYAARSPEPVATALRQLAQAPFFRSFVDMTLDLDLPGTCLLPPERANHLLAIVREALANVVRHARARHVHIAARLEAGRLIVTVQDDGVGLPRSYEPGYGMRNMQDRARLLDGQLEVNNLNGKGVSVRLDIPWKDER